MNRIKTVLQEKEISQRWLARQIGKSYNIANCYMNNRRQPSIRTLIKIAEVLNIKLNKLLK